MVAAKPILHRHEINSCSFRVQIALNLKGVNYGYRLVTRSDTDYEKINPIKYVPALVDGDFVFSDSLTVILRNILNTLFCLKISKKKAINLQDHRSISRKSAE